MVQLSTSRRVQNTSKMSSNASKNDLNREYIYVRRLISVLTNDDSDKLIVEKLKGKNLSSLLYNAKIIDNSKNMTANKKILACVIRAIEREKHLCHKRELEQSWGRKFLKSFNCLYLGLKTDDDCTEHSMFSRGCVGEKRSSHKTIKRRTLSKRTKTSSTQKPKTACKSSLKNGCNSSMRCAETVTAEMGKHNLFMKKPNNYVDSFRNKTYSCIDSIGTDKAEDKDDDLLSECWKSYQQVPVSCIYKCPKMEHETICPTLLRQRKLNCVVVYPGRPLPAIKRVEKAEKKSSSTQTSDSSYEPDPLLPKLPNNIKLQDLLEAASNLINTRDQREYVRSFLSNFEPPFDLSAGFPPYLKLPMKKSEDLVGKESVYGTNSESSLRSDRFSPVRQPRTTNDVIRQKEDNVRKYVRDLVCDPWQDTAESIISGVINESLPHDKADYSQLGACILKRLGAYPGSSSYKETRYRRQNLNIPEIILQCTEFFESDAGDSDKKPEPCNGNSGPEEAKGSKLDKSPSIVEIKLLDERGEDSKPWDGQRMQNYCFLDGQNASNQKVGLLNLSESSLVDIGTCQDKNELEAQGDVSQDRKNLQLREPLKITPSGLEQGGKKSKRAGMFERRSENKANAKVAESRRVPAMPNHTPGLRIENKEATNMGKPARQKVSIYTVTSDKHQEPLEKVNDPTEDSAVIESISILKPDSLSTSLLTTVSRTDDHANTSVDGQVNARLSQIAMPAEITETETPPPEPAHLPQWEPAVAEVETFNGVGEGQKKLAELPISKSDKKQLPNKNRTFREKIRGKKKCKLVSKKKGHSDKNDMELSRNCRVM